MGGPYPAAPVPHDPTPERLARTAEGCRACDLWEGATQAVLGEGPAGRVLDDGLDRAGLPREEVFVTNIVKHFRYSQRGKRRIHQTPDRWQVNACLPWLTAELQIVGPEALICLGAVAARALLGSQVRIERDRGRPIDNDLAPLVAITAHPSSIQRISGRSDRDAAMGAFASDLGMVTRWLAQR